MLSPNEIHVISKVILFCIIMASMYVTWTIIKSLKDTEY